MEMAQRIGPQKLKAAAAVFVGLHVPLVGLVVYAMMTDLAGMMPVLIVALVSTLVGVVATIAALFQILNAPVAADAADRGYQLS